MAFLALAYLAVILLCVRGQTTAHVIGNTHQCGGKGFSCTGSNCHDAAWLGSTCDLGLTCLRDNEQWWHCGRYTELGGRPGSELVWADEFDGSSLDTSHWNMELGDGAAYPEISGGWWGWGNDEQQCYMSSPSNVRVADGLLTISAKHQPATPCVNYNIYTNVSHETSRTAWTSAKITSASKKAFKWFEDGSPVYVEARVQAPSVSSGRAPGFWFLPSPPSPYGRWPDSGEIDVGKHASHGPAQLDPSHGSNGGSSAAPAAAPGEFHVWAIEWAPTYIAWILDGQEVHRSPSSEWHSAAAPDKVGAPFDQPFYAIFNLAIDGVACPVNQTCAPLDPSTSHFNVDYIRAWKVPKSSPPSHAGPTPAAVPKLFNKATLGLNEGPPTYTLTAITRLTAAVASSSGTPPACSNTLLLLSAVNRELEQQLRSHISSAKVQVTSSFSGCQAPGRQFFETSQITITATASVAAWISLSQLQAVSAAVQDSVNSPSSPFTTGSFASKYQVTAAATMLGRVMHLQQASSDGSRGFRAHQLSSDQLPSLYSVNAAQLNGAGLALVGIIACIAGISAWSIFKKSKNSSSVRSPFPLPQGYEQDLSPAVVVYVGEAAETPSLPHALAQHVKVQPMEEPLLSCCSIPASH